MAALPVVFVGRVTAAVARASPTVLAATIATISKAASSEGVILRTAKDVIAWVKRSPAAAAMVAAALIQAGVALYDLFKDDTSALERDAETASTMQMLKAAEARVMAVEDKQADVKLSLGNRGDQLFGKELVRYLRGRHGGAESIKRAHLFERAFAEIDSDTLSQLLDQYA